MREHFDADGLRLIDASEWPHQRWGWLEGVRRDPDLSPMARLVAHVLALDFAHHATLRCDPSVAEIGRVLGCSKDTVKRAVTALVDAGWVARECGLGRGHNSGYGFLTRAKIVPIKGGKFAPPKGGKSAPYSRPVKGGKFASKRGQICSPPLNSNEPYKNHGAGAAGLADEKTSAKRASGNPMVHRSAERAVAAFRSGRPDAISAEPAYVQDHIEATNMLTPEERRVAGFAEKGEDGR